MLTYKIGITNNSNDINYLIIDESIETNECYYVFKALSYYENFVKIWKIKSRNELIFFDDADIYFLRGNYNKFYNMYVPKKPNVKTIFYPATSFKHNLMLKRIKPLENRYDVVLIHEDPKYKRLYENNQCVMFRKFAPNTFINYNWERVFDVCFVATEKQLTKNHKLFMAFVEYVEELGLGYNIMFVGNLNVVAGDENYTNKFQSVKLEFRASVGKEELIEIYNRSKNNLIFSGRDAFPRVIAESCACGCFNIGLDTLMDGIEVYDGLLGVLISEPDVKKEFIKDSLSYVPDNRLFDKIISEISKVRVPNDISLSYKKKFSMDSIVSQINTYLL